MDDTIVTLRFTDVGRARAAPQELERLNRAGRLRVRGAARVERSGRDGRIGVPEVAGDGALPPQGEVVGMLVSTLSGPLGILVSPPAEGCTEGFERHGKPSAGEDRREEERDAAADWRAVGRVARRRPLTGSRR